MRRILVVATLTIGIALTAFLALVLSGSGRRADVARGADDPPNLFMDQASYSAAVGDTFHVLIDVTGLGIANCSHYQFGLTYDNTLVNIIASTPDLATGCVGGLYVRGFAWYYGPPLNGAGVDCGQPGIIVPASPPFTDPQQVVDFTFQCLRDGEGLLAFGDIYLEDGSGNPIYVVNTGADVTCGAGEPTSTPTETPTPTCTTNPADTPTPTSTPSPTGTPTQTPAGTSTPTSTATLTPTNTPVSTNSPTATPTRMSTVQHRHTPTPVPTDTPAATATPMPPAATSTPLPPPAAPSPSGGAGPVITGPSTGSGPGSDSFSWLPAAWLLLAAGGTAIAAGIVRWRAATH
jgi:hypothetical protein